MARSTRASRERVSKLLRLLVEVAQLVSVSSAGCGPRHPGICRKANLVCGCVVRRGHNHHIRGVYHGFGHGTIDVVDDFGPA